MTLKDAMSSVYDRSKIHPRNTGYVAFFSRKNWLQQQVVEIQFDKKSGFFLNVSKVIDVKTGWQPIKFMPHEWVWHGVADDWIEVSPSLVRDKNK